MSDEVTEERRVWLLVKAPRKAPPEVRYSRILGVHTTELRAKRAQAALPLLERIRTHVDEQVVEITGPRGLRLDEDYSVEKSKVTRIEHTLKSPENN